MDDHIERLIQNYRSSEINRHYTVEDSARGLSTSESMAELEDVTEAEDDEDRKFYEIMRREISLDN